MLVASHRREENYGGLHVSFAQWHGRNPVHVGSGAIAPGACYENQSRHVFCSLLCLVALKPHTESEQL